MQGIFYLLIALGATTLGAMTGMGGGVMIKPALDLLGDFDVATINLLSSMTVLIMSLVTVARQAQQKTPINYRMALSLAVGSVLGGSLGQKLLSVAIAAIGSNQRVTIIQNALLGLMIVGVFSYMLYKSRIRSLGLTGIFPALAAGLLLGTLSSFLGIGGGPINVALLIWLFSFDTKTAAINSLITILFAQVAKLTAVAMTTGFAPYDMAMLLPMAIGGVAGGLIGSKLQRVLSEKAVERGFNAVQVLVFCICMLNIVRSLA